MRTFFIRAFHKDICISVYAHISAYIKNGKTTYFMRFLRLSAYAEKYIFRICGPYKIRIHYADWQNICAYVLIKGHICIKPHRLNADLENVRAYSVYQNKSDELNLIRKKRIQMANSILGKPSQKIVIF